MSMLISHGLELKLDLIIRSTLVEYFEANARVPVSREFRRVGVRADSFVCVPG